MQWHQSSPGGILADILYVLLHEVTVRWGQWWCSVDDSTYYTELVFFLLCERKDNPQKTWPLHSFRWLHRVWFFFTHYECICIINLLKRPILIIENFWECLTNVSGILACFSTRTFCTNFRLSTVIHFYLYIAITMKVAGTVIRFTFSVTSTNYLVSDSSGAVIIIKPSN